MSCIGIEATIRLALTKQLPVVSVSDGIEELLGIKAKDLLSSSVHLKERIHAPDAEIFQTILSANNAPASGSCELRFREATGRIRLVLMDFCKSAGSGGAAFLELHLQDPRNLSHGQHSWSALLDRSGVENTPDDFLYIKDRNHVITWANEKFLGTLRDSSELDCTMLGLTDYDLFCESYADANYAAEEKLFADMTVGEEIRETSFGDQHEYHAAFCQTPLRDELGEVVGVACFSRDLSRQRQEEQAQRAREAAQEKTLRIAGIGTYALEMSSCTWTSSEVFDELFGIDKEYPRTLDGWRALIQPEDSALLHAHLDPPLSLEVSEEGSDFDLEYRIVRKADHAVRWIRDLGRREFDAAGKPTGVQGTVQDITKYKEAARQLELVEHYDALTGLPNRALLTDRVQQSMAQLHRRKLRMALAYLDLDGFRAVNEKHGREVGDELLKALSSRLQGVLRRGDTIARLGGDEFVVLVHDLVNEAASVPTLARLLNAVTEPILIGMELIKVSVSIGVAFYPQEEDLGADQLIRQADHAMYQAKLLGRNRYHLFDPLQDRAVRSHQETLDRIRKALLAHEFLMYYQPKVNMGQGKVVGVEALIRWQHPEKGLLPAGVFLPFIENHPLAEALGAWVIGSVLTQMELWLDAGLDIPVSINIGNRQLRQPDFVESLARLLALHPRIQPAKIELEIQGASEPQDMERLSRLQEGCRALGVTLALQKFGTGSATLNDLRNSAATLFKIDQGFVRDIVDDPKERSILEGVLGLAAAFSRQSLAEGVESLEHGLAVLRMGCELAQGYGIAYPMPADELPNWVAQWRPDPRWALVALEGKEEHPLLRAEAEHLAWVAALRAFFKHESQTLPQLGRHQCKLGTWLDAETLAGRGSQPEFQAIVALHWRIHALAAGVMKLSTQNRTEEALTRVGEMSGLLEKMFEHLKILKLPR